MTDPADLPEAGGSQGRVPALLVLMLVNLVIAGAKILTAYYTGVLLLAADGLYTLVVWYRRVFAPALSGRKRSESMVAVIPGLILASAALGGAWSGIAGSLELFQGLAPAGFSPAVLIVASGALLLSYLVRLGFAYPEELFYERGVSLLVLLIFSLVAAGAPFGEGFLVLGGLLLAIFTCVLAVKFVYALIEGILTYQDS